MNKIENGKKQKGFKQRKMKSPMLISLFSFAVCFVMLSTCCYAWFTAAQGAKINIEAGTFGVKAVVSKSTAVVSQSDVVVGADDITQIEVEATGNESVSVTVKNGGTYRISLTATGEASKGYCKVTVTVKGTEGQTIGESKVYHTGPMLKAGAEFAFTLVSTEGGTTEITIQPSWGEYEYQKESDVVSTLITGTIAVTGEVEAPVENIAEIVPEETSTAAETATEETTTEAMETTVVETTSAVETTAVETTEAVTTTAEKTTTEETTEAVESTEAETSTEMEAAETTTEVETTTEETVETSSETATTEATETTAETTEAVETAETPAEGTTAEATTESLSAEE